MHPKRIVFTADVQLHAHSSYSHINSNGRNSRLEIGLDTLRQAAALAGPEGVLVINGDLFHDRKQLDIGVLHATWEAFAEITAYVHSTVISVGNHDQYSRDGSSHSLCIFESLPNTRVFDDAGYINYGNTQLFICPYIQNLDSVRYWIKQAGKDRDTGMRQVMLLHAPICTAKLGGGRVSTSGLTVEDLELHNWGGVLLGHYHKPQQLFDANVHYIGSPYQVDWTESGDRKRFMVMDLTQPSGVQFESVPVRNVPEFRRMPHSEWRGLPQEEQELHFFELVVESLDEVDLDSMPINVQVVAQPAVKPVAGESGEASFDVGSAVHSWMDQNGHSDLVDLALQRLQEVS